jgi:hypothetical protein
MAGSVDPKPRPFVCWYWYRFLLLTHIQSQAYPQLASISNILPRIVPRQKRKNTSQNGPLTKKMKTQAARGSTWDLAQLIHEFSKRRKSQRPLLGPLVSVFPHLHVLEAHPNLHRLPETIKDIVLHIRHTVLFTHSLDLGGNTLVGEHTHARPHVVLNLVVQPAVKSVIYISPRPVVHRSNDSPQQEFVTLHLLSL